MTEPQRVGHRKFLGLVLRHQPDLIGLELDADGWVAIDRLLEALAGHGRKITRKRLLSVAKTDAAAFEVRDSRIRVRPGSVEKSDDDVATEGQLSEAEPPEHLYHGTADQFLASIRAQGIDRRGRPHVAMTEDPNAAKEFGARHGRPVVLRVHAKQMRAAGHQFFDGGGGDWLTESVPVDCFERFRSARSG